MPQKPENMKPVVPSLLSRTIPLPPGQNYSTDLAGQIDAFSYRLERKVTKFEKFHGRRPTQEELHIMIDAVVAKGLKAIHPSLHPKYQEGLLTWLTNFFATQQ